MRQFFVKFGNENQVLDQTGLQSLFKVALLRNKDIKCVFILEIDDRLSVEEGRIVASSFGHLVEYSERIAKGDTPIEALREWDII